MQSPQRKGKLSVALRAVHSEQLSKLQAKHQHECDLLEDIRNFSKQRATIEKTYGESLLKLSTSLLQHKIPVLPDVKSEDGKDRKMVYSIWRMVLDENEKLAKARLAAAEVFHQQISENAKTVKAQKIQITKKCLEQLQKIQEEIQVGVRDLDKTKKAYGDEEHVAHEARDKAHDAEERLKRKKGHFFQSLTSLQKNSAKFSSKKDACDVRSTGARNEYLLALAAVNAHQTRYHEVELPDIMKTMDAEVYEKVAEYFQLLSQTELFTCAATHSSFTKVKEIADLITRQYNVQGYMNEWTALKDQILYNFDPCDGDTVDYISSEHSSSAGLHKEGKRWAIKIIKESKAIREYNKHLRILLHQSSGGQKDESGGDLGIQDIEQKIEELRQNIRKSETSKLKAEARVDLLRQAGVNVDDWLKGGGIDIDTLGPLDMTGGGLSRAGSTLSVKTDVSGNVDDGCSEFYDSDYNDDASDMSASVVTSGTTCKKSADDTTSEPRDTSSLAGGMTGSVTTDNGAGGGIGEGGDTTSLGFTPMRCTAIYNYTAQNADELSILEQEVLEIVGEGDGDGWVKARNSQGQEGYVPQSYLEVDSGEAIPSSIYPAPTSFSSVDYTMPDWGDDDVEAVEVSTAAAAVPEDEEACPALPPPDLAPEDFSSAPIAIVENHVEEGDENENLCRAVYDYEATCPEELSFVEGQVIRILSKHVHDIDDGWWKGTVDGQVGIFPSLVVEELRSDGQPQSFDEEGGELMSPPGSAPPTFAPPPMPQFLSAPALVIITQPTPEVEHGDDGFDDESSKSVDDEVPQNEAQQDTPSSYSYATPDFDMELTQEQQSQYQTQFSATDNNANETEEDANLPDDADEVITVEESQLTSLDQVPDIVASTVVDSAQVNDDVESEATETMEETICLPERMEEEDTKVEAAPEEDMELPLPPPPPPLPAFEEHTG